MNSQRLLQLLTKVSFVFVVMLAFAATSFAQTTYYVSASAGNDNFDGSSANVVSGLVGPFKTINQALTVAVDGDTVVIEAGTYNSVADASISIAADLTIMATASGANSTVTIGDGVGMDLQFASNPIALTGGGATITTAGGDIDFESGTVTLAAGALTVPAGATVERTDGAVSGSAPTFAGAVTMEYNSAAAADQTAGLEIPASLGAGTLNITATNASNQITFPAGLTSAAINHTGAADAAFQGGVTANGLVTASGGDVTFAALTANAGIAASGTSFTAASIVVDDADNISNSTTFTVTGDVTFQVDEDNAAYTPLTNTGTASFGSTTFTYVDTALEADASDVDNVLTFDNDGTFTTGAWSEAGTVTATANGVVFTATRVVSMSVIVDNGANDTFTFNGAAALAGSVVNAGPSAAGEGVFFNAGGSVAGAFDNDGTVTIASGQTLDLTSDAAVARDVDDINGGGTLLISGDTNVSTTIDSDGNVTISGDGGVTGNVTVDGIFSHSGDGDVGGDLDIGGDYSHTGDGDVNGAGPHDVDGSATIAGNGNDYTGALDVAGDLTLGTSTAGDGPDITGALSVGNDLTVNNDVTVGGNFTADNVTVNGAGAKGAASFELTSTGGTHNVSEVLTINAGAYMELALGVGGSTFTVNTTNIDPTGTFDLEGNNDFVSQGNFTGGVFLGAYAGSELRFDLPSGNTEFAPGPNTQVTDFRVTGNERSLVVTQSFEVQNDFFVADDATIDLTNELVRMTAVTDGTGLVEVATDANVTTSENTGAISFEGPGGANPTFLISSDVGGQDIGTLTNLIVNTTGGSATTDVQVDEDLTITGVLSLVSGGFLIQGGDTVTFSGDGAGISRNIASATTVVTETGTLAGVYDLTYTGAGAAAPGSAVGDEYTDPGTNRIDDLTLNLSGGFVNLAEAGGVGINGDFTVSATSSATLTNNLDVPGNITINATTANDGNVALGGGTLSASGSGATHMIHGVIGAPVAFNANATVMGNTSDNVASNLTNVTVGNAATDVVTISNIQNILGNLTVNGDLTLGLSNANGIAAGDQQIFGDVLVDEGGSLTLSSAIDLIGVATGLTIGNGGAGVASLDLDGNTLLLSAATADFAADGDASIGSTGTLRLTGGVGQTIGSQAAGTSPAVLPTVNIDAAGIVMSSNMAVGGTLDVDEDFSDGGNTLTLSGDATFVDTSGDTEVNITGGGTFVTTGTTLTMTEDVEMTNFTVNSSSTTSLSSNNATSKEVYVNGVFRMQNGTLDLGDQDVVVDGVAGATLIDWDGGEITAASGELIIRDDDDGSAVDFDTDASAASASIPNLTVGVTAVPAVDANDGFQINSGDAITVTGILRLTGGFIQTNFAAPTADGSLTVADGARIIRNLGVLEQVPTFGGTSIDVEYDAAVTTDNELPGTFDELQLDAAITLEDDVDITINTLDINVAGSDLDVDGDNGSVVTITAGGTVQISSGAGSTFTAGVGAAGSDDGEINYAGAYNLVYDGNATADGITWQGTADTVTVDDGTAGGTTLTLGASRTAMDITISGSETLAVGANTLTVTGDLTQNGGLTTAAGGTVTFGGAAAQTFTVPAGGNTIPNVTVNNAMGVTLSGGNLTVGTNLALTTGLFNTGSNVVILSHGGTGAQGFTRTSGGVFGNIRKTVDNNGVTPAADRMTYPTAGADGSYRPVSVTFNNPNQISNGTGVVTLTARHIDAPAGGNNNLPLTTVDNLGNDLTIARYPDFHWLLTTNNTLSPSVSYDVELNAGNYSAFAGEDIERTRTIRRQGGATTNFWFLVGGGVAGNNDNYANSSTNPVTVVRSAVGALNSGNGVLFSMGLESNMTVTNPAAVSVNAGATDTIDLSTVFGGGTGAYTYAITSADAAVATGAAAANTLTVSGVAAGSTTLTVVATDVLNDTRTATVAVTVNPALAASSIDAVALNAGGTSTVDLSTVFTGGADPVTYAVASDDAAVAMGAEASGTLTITAVAAGSATITVTATDATAQTATATVAVSVNAAMSATNPDTITLTEGASQDVDLSTVFSGGDGTYTYAVSSAAANVTAAEAAGTLTVTAADAYAAGTTIATVDVTVTATDGLGSSVSATVTVDVLPVLGDLDGSGSPSAASASIALDYFLGLTTLTAKQQVAADFNGDGSVNAFDAALIFNAFLNGKDELNANVAANLQFGTIEHAEGMINIPLQIAGDLNEVVAASFTADIDPAKAKVVAVTSELDGEWIVKHTVSEEGQVRIAVAGLGTIPTEGTIATISVQLTDAGAAFDLVADGSVNNNTLSALDAVEVVELPDSFTLQGNYPNPFNPTTTIQFDLPQSADVEVQVYDMVGRQVMTLPAQNIAAGSNRSVQLNASQLASGSYFYRVIARMESKTFVETGRMLLLK